MNSILLGKFPQHLTDILTNNTFKWSASLINNGYVYILFQCQLNSRGDFHPYKASTDDCYVFNAFSSDGSVYLLVILDVSEAVEFSFVQAFNRWESVYTT